MRGFNSICLSYFSTRPRGFWGLMDYTFELVPSIFKPRSEEVKEKLEREHISSASSEFPALPTPKLY